MKSKTETLKEGDVVYLHPPIDSTTDRYLDPEAYDKIGVIIRPLKVPSVYANVQFDEDFQIFSRYYHAGEMTKIGKL